ncbi:MAG TPA: Rap1a/Tai family immunity protein [Alphaproteobacteria bacterium]|nr:Rap1a/Tai family immunity protein [Alphaproteobacteria bacterium]
MRLISLLLIAVIAMMPRPVKAQATGALISGAYLLEICKRDAEGKEVVPGGSTACQAYIAGIIDYHNLLRSLGTAPSIDICVPNTVKMSDLQDIVWKYLEGNAQHDAFIAAPAVSLALFEVFPCKGAVRK